MIHSFDVMRTLCLWLLVAGAVFLVSALPASAFTFSGASSWAGPVTAGNYYCRHYVVGSWMFRPICEINGLNTLPDTILNPSPSIFEYDTFTDTTWATFRMNDLRTTFAAASGEDSIYGQYNSLTGMYLGEAARSRYKHSECPANRALAGARFFEWTSSLDDEHVEASCAPVSGVTFGARSWYAPASPGASISGYKTVSCPAGRVGVGVRMYGVPSGVDDEYVEISCASVTNTVFGASRWVEAPNAWTSVNNSYKTAACGAGEVVTGLRWYQVPVAVDDEHVDIYCTAVSPTPAPSVQLNFQ